MLVRKLVLGSLVALGLSGCASQNPNARQDSLETKSPVMVPPNAGSLFVRASFDSDGESLIGAFFPDDVVDAQLDESVAARTRCSKFIKPRKVSAGGNVEEAFGASSGVGGRFGVTGIAQIKGERGNTEALRIKYAAKEKLVADVDVDGLAACCASEPDQCTKRYIGSVLAGDGEVYAATERKDDAGLDAEGSLKGTPISGNAFYKDGVKWERKSDFQGQYFAFGISRSRAAEVADRIGNDCKWVNRPPKSMDGEYFVGVSEPTANETEARKRAEKAGRDQVVRYLGEWFETSSQENQKIGGAINAVGGELKSESSQTAFAQGIASLVRVEAWCGPEKQMLPNGEHQVMRVLMFFPHTQRPAALRIQLTNALETLRAKGQLTPSREAAIQQALAEVK